MINFFGSFSFSYLNGFDYLHILPKLYHSFRFFFKVGVQLIVILRKFSSNLKKIIYPGKHFKIKEHRL